MAVSLTTIVAGFWIFAGVIAVAAIGLLGWAGWRDVDASSVLKWRRRKLLSAILGSVGVVMLLVNFDRVVREAIQTEARDFVFAEYVDAKFYAVYNAAIRCANKEASESARLTCFDMDQVVGQLFNAALRSGRELGAVTNWARNPEVEEFAGRMNAYFRTINGSVPVANIPKMLTNEYRMFISVLATFLIIIAVAVSVGEAAFQYRHATEAVARINTT